MNYTTCSLCIMMLLGIAGAVIAQEPGSGNVDPVTVSHVDLNKYIGTWYEIAKIPNPFQRKCAMNTTATYSLRDDGEIEVTNRCVESDGSENVAKGVAKIVDPATNSKLEVSFVRILGIQLFWGDYWIIGLDSDYRYAVVGTPSRKYGWILSRTPTLSQKDMDSVNQILRDQGYDPKDFVPTKQIETH
jgi:apolipoprotein D and lipocalin family protein